MTLYKHIPRFPCTESEADLNCQALKGHSKNLSRLSLIHSVSTNVFSHKVEITFHSFRL